jgi:hypothetical protein
MQGICEIDVIESLTVTYWLATESKVRALALAVERSRKLQKLLLLSSAYEQPSPLALAELLTSVGKSKSLKIFAHNPGVSESYDNNSPAVPCERTVAEFRPVVDR